MIAVATFLLDLDRITEPALQRIATIVLRQLHNGSNYVISHDQLVRRIRNLNTGDQDIFLEELKQLLVNMMMSVTSETQPTVETTLSGDELVMSVDSMPKCDLRVTERPQPIATDESDVTGASGGESIVVNNTKADENQELAEADQKCCLTEDGARSAADCHGVSKKLKFVFK